MSRATPLSRSLFFCIDMVSKVGIIYFMNNKAKKTLKAIFNDPVSKTLPWIDIEALFVALGASMVEGNVSRVKFDINGKTIAFHRPHNPKTARAYQIELAREFLLKIGVKP